MVASLISPQGLNSRNLRQSSPEGVSKNSFGACRNTLTYRRTFDRHHTLFSNRASRKRWPDYSLCTDPPRLQVAEKCCLNSQKITLRFRRLHRVTFASKRSPEGHLQKKKHLRKTRKCLIFNVDQPGLEPGTSRL